MRTITLTSAGITAVLGVLIPFLTAVLAKTHARITQAVLSFALAVGTGIVGYIEANPTRQTFDLRQFGLLVLIAGVSAAGTRVSWLGDLSEKLNYAVPGVIGSSTEEIAARDLKRRGVQPEATKLPAPTQLPTVPMAGEPGPVEQVKTRSSDPTPEVTPSALDQLIPPEVQQTQGEPDDSLRAPPPGQERSRRRLR